MSPLELNKKVRQGQHATITRNPRLTATNTLFQSTPATADVTAQVVASAEVGPPRCCWQVRPGGQGRPLHRNGAHHGPGCMRSASPLPDRQALAPLAADRHNLGVPLLTMPRDVPRYLHGGTRAVCYCLSAIDLSSRQRGAPQHSTTGLLENSESDRGFKSLQRVTRKRQS